LATEGNKIKEDSMLDDFSLSGSSKVVTTEILQIQLPDLGFEFEREDLTSQVIGNVTFGDDTNMLLCRPSVYSPAGAVMEGPQFPL